MAGKSWNCTWRSVEKCLVPLSLPWILLVASGNQDKKNFSRVGEITKSQGLVEISAKPDRILPGGAGIGDEDDLQGPRPVGQAYEQHFELPEHVALEGAVMASAKIDISGARKSACTRKNLLVEHLVQRMEPALRAALDALRIDAEEIAQRQGENPAASFRPPGIHAVQIDDEAPVVTPVPAASAPFPVFVILVGGRCEFETTPDLRAVCIARIREGNAKELEFSAETRGRATRPERANRPASPESAAAWRSAA